MNVPAVFIITGALVDPGLTLPVLKPDASPVAVCVIVSLLCHAIACPTWTVVGFGAKDWLPSMPLIETVTVGNELGADAVGVCGVGAVGDAVFVDEPQAAAEVMSAASEKRIRVRFML